MGQRFKKLIFFQITVLFFWGKSNAQIFITREVPKSELGIRSGTVYYIGDINSKHFNNLHLTAGLFYKRYFDGFKAFKLGIDYGKLGANDAQSEDAFRKNRNLSFETHFFDLNLIYQIHFFLNKTSNSDRTMSPFVGLGIGLFYFNPYAFDEKGNTIYLRDLGTEGQGLTEYPNLKKYSLINFSFPLQFGIRYSFFKSIHTEIYYTARIVSTNYLDDVGTTYPNPTLLEGNALYFSDRRLDKTIGTNQRGHSSFWDMYFELGISLSVDIPRKKSRVCIGGY